MANPIQLRLRIIVVALVCAIFAVFTPVPATAAPATTGASYMVNCSARTNGVGSVKSPWNSLAAVNAHPRFQPGETILLKRGTTCIGRLHPRGNGLPTAAIVIGAYGTGAKPTVAGNGTASHTGAVQLKNQQWWTIQDLHVTNRGTAAETNSYRSAVLILNENGGRLRGVLIQRLTIDSVTSNLTPKSGEPRDFGGISVITAPYFKNGSGFDGLRILNNKVSQVGRTGIVVSNYYPRVSPDRGIRIAYNRVTRARGDSIMIRGSLDARIDHNVSAHGADFWPCKQCGPVTPATANAGIWPLASKRTTIEYNEIYGMHKLGGDGEGIDIDIDAQDTIVQYNYVHDNEGGGILFCGSTRTVARFNILQNNQQGAFTFIGSIPAASTDIYNNTVYSKVGNKALVVRTFGGRSGRNVTFFNNLIYNLDDSGYYVWPTNPKSRTNTYVGVHGIDEPQESGKGFVSPGVRAPGTGRIGFSTLAGYRVTPNVYTMAGSPIPKSVTTDFFGKKINAKMVPRGAAG